MTTPTPAPIAGNQNFSSVSNVAAQVPTLFVGELEASDAAVTNLTLDDGQVVTTQGTPPTAYRHRRRCPSELCRRIGLS